MRANWRVPARSSLPLLVASGVFMAVSLPAPVRAGECAPANGLSGCIDADNLWPHAGAGPFFAVGSTATAPGARASFGLVASYLSRPVGLRVASPDPDGTIVHLLDNMLDATFLWSLGLTDRLEVTIAAPVTLYQDGSGFSDVLGTTDVELQRSVLRDTRLGAAFAILPPPPQGSPDGFSLAARLELGLPTGDETVFASAGTVTFAPSAAAAYQLGKLKLAAEIGARLRGSSTLVSTAVGSQLLGALGAAVDVLPDRWLTASAEAFALYTLTEQPAGGAAPVPAEWIISATSAPLLAGDISLSAGGGGSIPLASEGALTAPRFRFNLGVRYAPTGRDADADGVLDRDDKCPLVAEDRDGFQDADGCPDPDNDGDRIPDERDRCRDERETIDGFQDGDGCADADDDSDGVPDDDDTCRNAAEDRDGFQDSDGCPDPDNDGDGIPDERDTCPRGAEDADGFQDADGCPDPDNDIDQVPDGSDQCPGEAEDRDGFQDDDGCPERDNDEDGVADAADACPATAETIDGTNDADGCPEPTGRSLPQWSGDRVTLDGLVRFPAGSARVPPALAAQVGMIAQLMRGRMPLDVIIVEAYPDRQGDQSTRAIELAGARASAVKELLASAGIPADRITAAAGDTSAKRAPGAPQIEVTATRVRRSENIPRAPGAASSTTGEKKPR
ncbi:OmpA family protein [Sorangium sp. So ce1389]|uniref:OmpA family protein n=1 Tax=Sorangium sp. So ce1389 TaxID=3133336 RepID=UPI003F62D664